MQPAHRVRPAFTLIELLVVLAIVMILAALLFPVFSRVRENGRAISCASNLRQVGMALQQYADDNDGWYPLAGNVIQWDAIDPGTGRPGWMQQLEAYTKSRQIFHCPSDAQSDFSYFLGARQAYLDAGSFASVNNRRIQFPTAFVLAGDTFSRTMTPGYFDPLDADKDDYSQNCVGGDANGTPAIVWQRHNGGQNLLYADGHVKKALAYNPDTMTFRYEAMHGWQ